MQLMRYKPVAEYVPRKNMTVADMLSRNPMAMKAEDSTQLSEVVDLHVNAITSSWPVSDTKLDQIREETKDINLKTALEYTVTELADIQTRCQVNCKRPFRYQRRAKYLQRTVG